MPASRRCPGRAWVVSLLVGLLLAAGPVRAAGPKASATGDRSLSPLQKTTEPADPRREVEKKAIPKGIEAAPARPSILRKVGPRTLQSPGSEAIGGAAGGDHLAGDPCGDRFAIDTIDASPPLDPGEQFTIHGCGFGPNPPAGEVRLLGDFPGGSLKLQTYGWTPHAIIARVPDVSGVPDLATVRLQVIPKQKTPSNWFDVGGFRAARESKRIHPTDVQVTCGSASPQDDDECELAKSFPLAEASFFQNATFAASHRRQAAPKDPDDCSALELLGSPQEQQTDTATVHLQNGWVVTGHVWHWSKQGSAWVNDPTGVAPGQSSVTVSVPWSVSVNRCNGPHASRARYRVELWAEGPKGVPYK